MDDLNLRDLERLKDRIAAFDLESALPQLSGLLTVPPLQGNTIRIETAIHLAVASCRGRKPIGRIEINRLLNTDLAGVAYREDPTEDVFVANVTTPKGNFRVFQGVWEANDYYAQGIIDVLLSQELPSECNRFLEPVVALLTVSEEIARRVNLHRWQHEACTPQGEIRIPSAAALRKAASAVRFSADQLLKIGINPGSLAPFILTGSDKSLILAQPIGNTSLERRPLVRVGKDLVCALPCGISPAIRRFLVSELLRSGHLNAFAQILAEYQFQETRRNLSLQLRQFEPHRDFPRPKGNLPSLHSLVINFDIDKYLHVVFLHERLELIQEHGFAGRTEYPRAVDKNLRCYVRRVTKWCKSQPGFREGVTLYVMGGLGGGSIFKVKRYARRWSFSLLGAHEFQMLTSEHDQPLTRYLKFLKQWAWIEKKGFRFRCFEHYTLYCHWRQTDYIPVPRELPLRPNSICAVLGGSARKVRAEVRSLADRHMLPNARGSLWPVRRMHSDSVFVSKRAKAIYASPYSAAAGFLAGAVVTSDGISWLTASTRPDQSLMGLPYQLWEGFIDLFERMVVAIESMRLNKDNVVLEVRLDCAEVKTFGEGGVDEPSAAPTEPKAAIDPASGIATVSLPAQFLHSFRQPENFGEKLLLQSIARGLIGLHQGTDEVRREETIRSIVEIALDDPGTRVIHAFHATDPVEIIREKKKTRKVQLFSQMDYRFLNVGLCDGLVPREHGNFLDSKEASNALLHKIVDLLFARLRRILQALDRTAVIREMLERQEAIVADRGQWTRTARAVIALHSASGDGFSAAAEREALRASTGLAARSVIEVAICECPLEGGRQISSWEADELLATMLCIVNTATSSEAIHRNLAEPRIELFENGEYDMDLSFLAQVMNPFLEAYNRRQFVEAADNYEQLYTAEHPDDNEPRASIFPNELVDAFEAEFGLAPERAGQGIIELTELAILREELVVETTVGEIKHRLMENCGYSRVDCDNFLRSFGLFHRPNWESPPAKCQMKDIYPWRYSRKLSTVVRPLLVFGEREDETILYSVAMLRLGFGYLIEKIKDGRLSRDFFSSAQMKQYIGRVNNRLGRAFEKEVATRLEADRWNVRDRLRMRELGAPDKLGDVDVLAWRNDGRVFIVECKRLQLARTVAEIADVCQRFKGEAQDELDKHMRRVKWIRENRNSLNQVLGFVPSPEKIEDRIVTSNFVPLTFLQSLPIEPTKIVPLPELNL